MYESIEEVSKGSELQLKGAENSENSMEEIAIGIHRIADTTTIVSKSSSITKSEAEKGSTFYIKIPLKS